MQIPYSLGEDPATPPLISQQKLCVCSQVTEPLGKTDTLSCLSAESESLGSTELYTCCYLNLAIVDRKVVAGKSQIYSCSNLGVC